MQLSAFKTQLETVTEVTFIKPDGSFVPAHFHITEIGQIDKRFIDCGGTMRDESVISMQLWESVDVWHRLAPSKLMDIINLSQQKLNIGDYPVEVEYQGQTIGKYRVSFENGAFLLTNTNTACLASDQCGIPSVKKVKEAVQACCSPESGCC